MLDILASRHPSEAMFGCIRVNALPRSQRYMKRIAAYVLQNDVLLSHLTVKELLLYTVDMRIERDVGPEEKVKRVRFFFRHTYYKLSKLIFALG